VIQINPAELPWRDSYKLLIGSVLPRPIAWVSTISRAGVPNLAPFSFYTGVCAKPLTVCFAPMVSGTTGGMKHTLRNIQETGEFVVNVVTEENVQAMNATSADFPEEVSEFEACGATSVPSQVVRPPRVAESPLHMECQLSKIITISEEPGGGWLVLGRVVQVHVAEHLYQQGRIDTQQLKPVGRLAGEAYLSLSRVFELKRPGR